MFSFSINSTLLARVKSILNEPISLFEANQLSKKRLQLGMTKANVKLSKDVKIRTRKKIIYSTVYQPN